MMFYFMPPPPPPIPQISYDPSAYQAASYQTNQNQCGMYQPVPPTTYKPPKAQNDVGPNSVWVENEKAAQEYQIAPNSAVALWSNTDPVVIYLKQSDAMGKCSMVAYDLVERQMESVPAPNQSETYVTLDEHNKLEAKVDLLLSILQNTKEREETT